MNDATSLNVEELNVSYRTSSGESPVVRAVSFALRKGTILGLVGESGSGKSTTVRAVLGLLGPNATVAASRIDFGEVDLRTLPRARFRDLRGREIGFVAQNPFGALNPIYPIKRQFFELHRAHRTGLSRQESRLAAHAQLTRVGIVDPDRVLDGYAHQLSGGMAQRVVIALASVLSPSILVADEPTTGLDVTVQAQIMGLLRRLVREQGKSMLIVTHDLGVVAQYCDDVVVMRDGVVVEAGRVADVFVTPQATYTKTLLASVLGGTHVEVTP